MSPMSMHLPSLPVPKITRHVIYVDVCTFHRYQRPPGLRFSEVLTSSYEGRNLMMDICRSSEAELGAIGYPPELLISTMSHYALDTASPGLLGLGNLIEAGTTPAPSIGVVWVWIPNLSEDARVKISLLMKNLPSRICHPASTAASSLGSVSQAVEQSVDMLTRPLKRVKLTVLRSKKTFPSLPSSPEPSVIDVDAIDTATKSVNEEDLDAALRKLL
ncbi:uncharacterized protein EDB93DRAFT_1109717 [Suillus bovinus]|uniref:uncharacterized protein n=1 Tax=Suillus bovinus TaxID=48563 RepID=UPI001B86B318|nr:uncharacterized protein EDB93DRAFT_1109717 [Suillus bovinus]KAG2126323.1 hypothetical protein EDB93DRAFT_1109717 [Suillus bovinus]